MGDLEELYKQLDGFNHLSIPSIPFQFKSKLPSTPGVYIVYLDSQVLYVGQAKDIHNRWRDHDVDGKISQAGNLPTNQNLRVGWILVPKQLLTFAEVYLIGLLHPVLNIAHKETFS
jgi:excinuclease UvrABC nuclease subunit